MAWVFGLYGFLDSTASTEHRISELVQMIIFSARRIEGNLGYALAQKNNHGISEVTGLRTVALLFPKARGAQLWRHRAKQLLESQARELIYKDGAFAQHSANYHRVMLQDYLWSVALGRLNGESFAPDVVQRLRSCCAFLHALQQGREGEVPLYGQCDGSLILALNDCSIRDFRPVIQAASVLFEGKRAYESGPWDEDLFWLGLAGSPEVEPGPKNGDGQAEPRSLVVLSSKSSAALVLRHEYRHRPSQADLLHVDLWHGGENVLLDPGTFSYNEAPPWDNPLAHSAFHNAPTVDGLDSMERFGKFLWLPWARARETKRQDELQVRYREFTHNGYERLASPVRVRRGIIVADDGVHSRHRRAVECGAAPVRAAVAVSRSPVHLGLRTRVACLSRSLQASSRWRGNPFPPKKRSAWSGRIRSLRGAGLVPPTIRKSLLCRFGRKPAQAIGCA